MMNLNKDKKTGIWLCIDLEATTNGNELLKEMEAIEFGVVAIDESNDTVSQ